MVVTMRTADVPTAFLGVIGYRQHHGERLVHRQVGLDAAARGAGARQHRIDGRRRQDDRAEDRDQGPADPIAERRHHQRRRLCLDRSVRQGRQRRRRQLRIRIGSTGHDWRKIRRWTDNNSWDANQRRSCSTGVSGYSPRSTCTREGVLLDFGLHDPEQLHRRGHLLAIGLHRPEQLHERGHLLDSGDTARAPATAASICSSKQLSRLRCQRLQNNCTK